MTPVKNIKSGKLYLEYRNDTGKDSTSVDYECQKCVTVFKYIRQDDDNYIISILDSCRSGNLENYPEGWNKELSFSGMEIEYLGSVNEIFELTDEESNKMAIAFL